MATQIDIINRALQRLGVSRIATLGDMSGNAAETAFAYDSLRRAELRRNVWRFSIRRSILRAVGTPLPIWIAATTYASGAFVLGSDTKNYKSLSGANTGNDPTTDGGVHWALYIGNTSQKVTFTAYASGTTYAQGAIVTASDNLIYLSLTAGNIGNDPTLDSGLNWVLYFGTYVASAWLSTTTYMIGELVFDIGNAVYASTINANANNPSTGIGWATIACTVAPIVIPWPAGTGPLTDKTSRNVFVLPVGFLRQAPSDPRAGETSIMGFPGNLMPTDWLFEGPYMVSRSGGPVMLRFAADVAQVSLMDDLFREGLSARIALEMRESFQNSVVKREDIRKEYDRTMLEARLINGIETSPTEPPLDDLILVRF